jgi:hypothetical protein
VCAARAWVAGRLVTGAGLGRFSAKIGSNHAPRPTSIRTYDSVFKDRAEVTFRLGGQESRGRRPTCQTQFRYFSRRCPKGGLVATSTGPTQAEGQTGGPKGPPRNADRSQNRAENNIARPIFPTAFPRDRADELTHRGADARTNGSIDRFVKKSLIAWI